MNMMNIFGLLLSFILGFTFVWLFFSYILDWIVDMVNKGNTEMAVFMSIALVFFAIVFVVVVPLHIGLSDETKTE